MGTTILLQIGFVGFHLRRGDLSVWWLDLGVISFGIAPSLLSARLKRLREAMEHLIEQSNIAPTLAEAIRKLLGKN